MVEDGSFLISEHEERMTGGLGRGVEVIIMNSGWERVMQCDGTKAKRRRRKEGRMEGRKEGRSRSKEVGEECDGDGRMDRVVHKEWRERRRGQRGRLSVNSNDGTD